MAVGDQDWEQLGQQAAARFPGAPVPELPQALPPGVHPVTNPIMGAGAPPPALDPTQQQQLAQQVAPAPPPPPAAPADDLAVAPQGPQTTQTKDVHTQYTPGVKLDPQMLADNKLAQAEAVKAQANIGKIESEAAAKIADARAEQARKEENERIVQENAAEKRRLAQEAAMQKIADAQKEVEAVQAPPEDSTSTKLKNALALALSQFGAALTGGRNGALDVINADREQKMRTWKAAYDRAKGKVADKQNVYAMLRERGLDDQQAEAATLKMLNAKYDMMVKQIEATSRAPLTLEQARVAQAKLSQDNTEAEARLQALTQARVSTTSDTKTVTKDGADFETKKKAQDYAKDNPLLKKYVEARDAFDSFNDKIKSGADGTAMVDFIANALKQGSYDPAKFNAALKKRGLVGETIETLRQKWSGGVPPDLLKEVNDSLAASVVTKRARAAPAFRELKSMGYDPRLIVGADTQAEAGRELGGTPR